VVQLARENATAKGVENAEYRTKNTEKLDETGYDLVYSHLGDPTKALKAMVGAR
jgi:hypothetical protein